MTDTELLQWIEAQKLPREEIGDILGYSKRTIDNWFSDGKVPEPARKHLIRIITESDQPGNLRFTLSQWDAIEAARIAAGYTDRAAFFTAALTEYARTHAARTKNITPMPEPTHRVADDETPYETKPKDLKGKQAG